MSTGPDLFHIAASFEVRDLSAATRALFDACNSAPDTHALVDWRDDDGAVHNAAREVPGDDVGGIGLTFAQDAAFGVLERKDDGTFGLGVQHVVAGLGDDTQRAVLQGWTDVCRALLGNGVLSGARVNRQRGGHCVPYLPLVTNAAHLVVCSARQVEQSFADPKAFSQGWDSVEVHDGMRLCLRALNALANPDFLGHILPGQMVMARAARPGLTRFYDPQFEPGELELLEAGDPTLTGVGYYAAKQAYEFAGHTPPGTDLRCIDLLMAAKLAAAGQVEGGGPVREVRVVFMNEEQATRSAKLLQEAGATVYWEDNKGKLKTVPPAAVQ